MINYNTREWFSLIFKFHKSDTFRILLPSLIALGLFCALVAFFYIEVLNLRYRSTTILHSLLGFVISLLLVFRTNTAYERWWEGRKMWGNLLNSSRNLAMKLNAFLGSEPEARKRFSQLISTYAVALKQHLRDAKEEGIAPLNMHQPNFIASRLFEETNSQYREGHISGEQLIILNNEIQSLTEICGACERIKKTPIPYAYSLFVKKFIFVYIITMPFSFVSDFRYAIIPIVMFVFYVLASLELIAEEIEEPFGKDANDLPVGPITRSIRESVEEILLERSTISFPDTAEN